MSKPDVSKYQTFEQITTRLDVIVDQVRDKDVSLERSLDLVDEAISLGSKAVDLVDVTEFTPEEEARMRDEATAADAPTDAPAETTPAAPAADAPDGTGE